MLLILNIWIFYVRSLTFFVNILRYSQHTQNNVVTLYSDNLAPITETFSQRKSCLRVKASLRDGT